MNIFFRLTDNKLNERLEQEETFADAEGVICENYEASDSDEDDAMQRDRRQEETQQKRSSGNANIDSYLQ